MIDEKKNERIRVLGVKVDSIKMERAVNLTVRYLEKHKFEYIVFANTPAALIGQEEEALEYYIDNAALILPGDTNIEDAVEARQWLEEGKSYQSEYFRRLFARLNKQGISVYLMIEKEEEYAKLWNILKEKYGRVQLEGIVWKQDASADNIVNSINSFAPDLLLVCGKHKEMSSFLEEHSCKINAGLCFCMEEIVVDSKFDVPGWMDKSALQRGLDEIKKNTSQFFHNFIFQKQMKQAQIEESKEPAEENEESRAKKEDETQNTEPTE